MCEVWGHTFIVQPVSLVFSSSPVQFLRYRYGLEKNLTIDEMRVFKVSKLQERRVKGRWGYCKFTGRSTEVG
jgi:hypothetical protein